MIKYLIIIVILGLNSCTSRYDIRPYALVQSESFMQQGVNAYQQDRYTDAIRSFENAVNSYQSIDNQTGILSAKINLIESALAISHFAIVEKNLFSLENIMSSQPAINTRITLLRAHYYFSQEQYLNAEQTVKPLLSQLSEIDRSLSSDQINILLAQTKFSIFSHTLDAVNGFKQLTTVINNNSKVNVIQKALYYRLAAQLALQQQDIEQAITLMQQSIDLYKLKANRRSIAICLQEMAEIYLAGQNIKLAQENFTRALFIRKRLGDEYKSTILTQKITQIQ